MLLPLKTDYCFKLHRDFPVKCVCVQSKSKALSRIYIFVSYTLYRERGFPLLRYILLLIYLLNR